MEPQVYESEVVGVSKVGGGFFRLLLDYGIGDGRGYAPHTTTEHATPFLVSEDVGRQIRVGDRLRMTLEIEEPHAD